jgi:signal transduction histidine kinase
VDGREVTLYVLSDVTEEKRARELMARHRDAVHQKARLISLGEFASSVAHELTQPLAAIGTYNNVALRLLDSGGADTGEVRDAMRKSVEQARRAGAIIQRLRELLRQPGPELAAHDLNEIAATALRLAEGEARDAGVATGLLPSPERLPVLADGVLIEQVVLNLLRNAIEATRSADSRHRKVLISTARHPDGQSTLAVTDWGEGMAPSIATRLFEPFVTGRPGGLGLGLSICRSVIEAHGGALRYRPNAGRGSLFEFNLPGRKA